MSGFHELVAHVEENVYLDETLFAEPVRLCTDTGEETSTSAHCLYRVREDDGVVVETLRATFLRRALPSPPDHRHRLYRADDDRAFLWRFNGGQTRNCYGATFERRTRKRQATK